MSEQMSGKEADKSKIPRPVLPEELLEHDQSEATRRILAALEKRGVDVPVENLLFSGGEQEQVNRVLRRDTIFAVPVGDIPAIARAHQAVDVSNNPFDHARKGASVPVIVVLDSRKLSSLAYDQPQSEWQGDDGLIATNSGYLEGNQELAWMAENDRTVRDAVVGIVSFRPEAEIAALRQRQVEHIGATAIS